MSSTRWRVPGWLILAVLLHSTQLCAQVITTVAGSQWVFHGGPATSAPLGSVWGVAVDAAGNVYASDQDNNLVVKISPSGILTVVAGNGVRGFSGDGGPATSASLYYPAGVAVDAAGNLYIADQYNHRIRKVSPSGIISTVAGIYPGGGFSGDGGPATSASLSLPTGVAVDAAGNLYIADLGNSRVRKVNTSGIITTAAGGGTGGDGGPATSALLWPAGVAVDAAGNLYIADQYHNRIRKVSPSGIISTVAGNGTPGFSGDGGPATSASFSAGGVAMDAAGNLYIADGGNNRIRRVDASGIITTVAGNGLYKFGGDGGPATTASLSNPCGVALDAAGNLYIADSGNKRIRKVSPSGIISTVAGNGTRGFSGDGGPATSASLYYPTGVAVDAAGNLYIADRGNDRIRRVNAAGIISTLAGNGTYGFSGDGGPATAASLRLPTGVAVDAAGNLYIADTYNGRVRKVTPSGTISTVAGGGAMYPGDGGPATRASLDEPAGVVVDGAGNLYIAGPGTVGSNKNHVHKVSSSGTISIVAGYGGHGCGGDGGPATVAGLYSPSGVAVDGAGNIYIADKNSNRIRRVDVSGMITSVAGSTTWDLFCSEITCPVFKGDGGPATSASLCAPSAVTLDAAGNLYIADSGHDRIRKVAASATAGGAPFEPQLTRFLNPGFYIVEATLAPSAAAGFWGLEVLTSVGQAAGGFNLGGALHPSGDNTPGFGAFLLVSAQTVTANLDAQVSSGASLSMRFLDANKRQIGAPVSGPPPLRLGLSLSPGFYVVEVYNGASSPVTYQVGLAADFFSGGVDTGGYLGPGIVGFGAFYVPVAQNVTMTLFGQKTYGSAGAGSMVLTLRDSNRQILQVVGP